MAMVSVGVVVPPFSMVAKTFSPLAIRLVASKALLDEPKAKGDDIPSSFNL